VGRKKSKQELNGKGKDVETLILRSKVRQVQEEGGTATKNSKQWQFPNGCSILRVVEKWNRYM
jgi:hypothetical protein